MQQDNKSHTPVRFKKRLRMGRYDWGRMIMFQYDPVSKRTLPYYDRFPIRAAELQRNFISLTLSATIG